VLFTGGVDGAVLPWRHPTERYFVGRIQKGTPLGGAEALGASAAAVTALVMGAEDKSLLCAVCMCI